MIHVESTNTFNCQQIRGLHGLTSYLHVAPRCTIHHECKHVGKHANMTLAFSLRRHSSSSQCTVGLRVSLGRGAQFRLSTDVKLQSPTQWNESTKRIRALASIPHEELNAHLETYRNHIQREIIRLRTAGETLTQDTLNAISVAYLYPERAKKETEGPQDLAGAFDMYLTRLREGTNPMTSKSSSPSTIESLEGTLKHLEYLRLHSTKTSDVDLDWHGHFIAESECGGRAGQPLSLNYIGKHIKNIKTVLRYAHQRDWSVNKAFQSREFRVPQECNEDIYLNRKEIDMLLEVSTEVLTPSEQLSRDLFIIGCFSGLRVSDYKQLSKEDLVEEDDTLMFEVRSNKTDTLLTIPVHPLIRKVLSRHHGAPPPLQSEVLINRNMKRIGRLAGIDRVERTSRTIGGRRQSTTQPKYELITSHTARRSFATNAYLAGSDTIDIMAITGHTKESTFLRYIKVTPRERAKRIAKQAFFQS